MALKSIYYTNVTVLVVINPNITVCCSIMNCYGEEIGMSHNVGQPILGDCYVSVE